MLAVTYALQHYVDPALGAIIETGVASGKSLRAIVDAAPAGHPIFGFDWFEGLPEDWLPWFPKGHFSTGGVVPDVPGAMVVKALVEDGLPVWCRENPHVRLAMLHVDTDLYAPAKVALDVLNDRIVPGTIIVFDEYHNYPGWEAHEHRAFSEWRADYGREMVELPTGDTTEDQCFRKTFRVTK